MRDHDVIIKYGLEAFSKFLILLNHLAKANEYRTPATEKFTEQFKPSSPEETKKLETAFDFIQINFQTSVSLGDVAKLLDMSESSSSTRSFWQNLKLADWLNGASGF